MTILHLLLSCAIAQATPPAATPPAATPPAVTPPAATPPAKAPAGTATDSKKPVKDKAGKKAPAKKAVAKEEVKKVDDAPAAVPGPELSPEMQKIAKLAADPKFKEYTRLAAERQELFKKSSALRMAMRGVEPTQSQIDEVKSLQAAIGKVNDKMDSCIQGKKWTADDYAAMDFIVSEQMRINPLE